MKTLSIAANTFREAARNKIFYLLIGVGVFFAVSSELIGLLSLGDRSKVVLDVGLASINYFSVLIAIFTGINLVYKEIDKKTVYFVLTKPIHRSQFIIGKFLGLGFTILLALFFMVLMFFLFLHIGSGAVDLRILVYFLLLYFELLIIIALAVLFSSVSSPILASIYIICLYLIGHIVWTYQLFKDKIEPVFLKLATSFIYYILPNLEKFNIKSEIVLNRDISWGLVAASVGYGVVYVLAILMSAIMVFNRKQFK